MPDTTLTEPSIAGASSAAREPINLGHLRVFVVVAESGSVTLAAATLYRAQSAVTRSIQELEAALGEPLFERRPSGMLVTPVGRVVVERGKRALAELEELAHWCAARQSRTRSSAPSMLPAYLLNTRRLQILVALARHRHMPSAAKTLGISQPAVSSAIRILESGASMQLFHRSARGLQLSREGDMFALHVRRALNELRHVPEDIAALRGTVRGLVTVGALPLGRTLILPEATARVCRTYAGVRVATDESAYETLVASLRAGDIDFILGALRPTDPAGGLVGEPLMAEGMVVLTRRDHPIAGLRGLSLKQLSEQQWILPRSHAPARALLDALFVRSKLKPPTPTVETADLAMIRGLLLRTDMVAALSQQQLHYERETGQLAMLDIAMPGTQRDIGLTMRAGSVPSPAARKLLDAIREVVRDQTGRGDG
ncbi:LysR family transcriptional regulator [Pararobbsia alpina]|uniref:HTH-type transcriptional regulator HdfR n=1 Tax=Pararobbsia alpina TaxID=621374 RepID=A0A6S7AWJ6_9BURK|nr:LysR family transcriptional regulator [Pararobbsia alpina]CAB3780034.1 HTH-type transcriptional regulator HdfR [Pararobbsia alpina]